MALLCVVDPGCIVLPVHVCLGMDNAFSGMDLDLIAAEKILEATTVELGTMMQQPTLSKSLQLFGRGYLFRLLPVCVTAGSVYYYFYRPDYPRYDSATWLGLGALAGLVIGCVFLGFLTLLFRWLAIIWKELN